MDQQKENKFDELYRLLDITAKSRYRAATRLKIHGLLSQCTLSLLAIGLIISSLFTLSDMKILLDSEYVSVMQIIFSVLILTYSLLLGIGDFGVRSSDYHLCGLEISRLLR
ncbi:SLATT domain-containing protein, partial [Marinomonas ostreistagni]